MNTVDVSQGSGPIILGQPHGGTWVPDDIFARLNASGQELGDTDWHISSLYDELLPEMTVVRSNVHRYVIDANRDPSGVSLYPGQNTTSLCPTTTFDGNAIWHTGQEPTKDEISQRLKTCHAPYHQALAEQIARVLEQHGVVLFYDCHSIRSKIPFLFEGELPVFNIGSDLGTTCHAAIEQAVHKICVDASGYDTVLNGRFRGGWSTRHYANPEIGIHAIQMEIGQRAYMDEKAPWKYHGGKAQDLREILAKVLQNLDHIARSGALSD